MVCTVDRRRYFFERRRLRRIRDIGLSKRFEEEYTRFIEQHLKLRVGESARRLQAGHGHAEKLFLENVWWLAIGHFEHLHPEYEVMDYKDGFRYLDFHEKLEHLLRLQQ
ncbi:hypothetical protein D3C78_531490 [compost metagenome]